MEVVVGAVEEAPADVVLSIKAGHVRRQGALRSGMHFVFPQVPEQDCELSLLLPCGGPRRLGVNALQKGSLEESVQLDTSAGHARFDVSAVAIDEDGDQGVNALHRHQVAVAAKEYMDRHGLHSLVQQMLRDVLDQKPLDPVAAMVAFLEPRTVRGAAAETELQGVLRECEQWRVECTQLAAQLDEVRAEKERAEKEAMAPPPSRANVSTADTMRDIPPRQLEPVPDTEDVAAEPDEPVESLEPDLPVEELADTQQEEVKPEPPEEELEKATPAEVTDSNPAAEAPSAEADFEARLAEQIDQVDVPTDGMSAILQTMRQHKLKADSMRDELDEWVKQVLDSAEFRSVADDRFDQCDVLNLGRLHPSDIALLLREIVKAFQFDLEPHHFTEFVEIFDLNDDGAITRDEFFAFVQVIFVNLAMANSRRLSEASSVR